MSQIRIIVTCSDCEKDIDAILTPSQPETFYRGEPQDPPTEASLDPPECPDCGAELDADEVEREAKEERD